ncbi:hypothetical protein ABW21_db0204373 [Orbilia brochopaga]|nr:hypothetical protein ABW21_db0204373 [Drechslerella brochopaga]
MGRVASQNLKAANKWGKFDILINVDDAQRDAFAALRNMCPNPGTVSPLRNNNLRLQSVGGGDGGFKAMYDGTKGVDRTNLEMLQVYQDALAPDSLVVVYAELVVYNIAAEGNQAARSGISARLKEVYVLEEPQNNPAKRRRMID